MCGVCVCVCVCVCPCVCVCVCVYIYIHTHKQTHTHLGVERGGNGAHGDVIMCRAYPTRRDHQVTRATLPPNLRSYFRGVVTNLYIYVYI